MIEKISLIIFIISLILNIVLIVYEIKSGRKINIVARSVIIACHIAIIAMKIIKLPQ